MSHLSSQLARAVIAEQLRIAQARPRQQTRAGRLERIGGGADAHNRQRALVCASLLLSPRHDAAERTGGQS
jgi:hypothetical protein